MRKILVFAVLLTSLAACGGSSENNAMSGDTTNNAGMTNPSAIDTTEHPNGITNGDVISTDTAAMNTQKAIDKAKAAKNK